MTERLNSRIKCYRLFKKMKQTFQTLKEFGKLTPEEHEQWTRVCEALYAEWRETLLRTNRRPAKKRGRPVVIVPRNTIHPTCKAASCGKPSAPGQVYCSPLCAPLAQYGVRKRA